MDNRLWLVLVIAAGVVILATAPLPHVDSDAPLFTRIAMNVLETGDWMTFHNPGWIDPEWTVDKPPVTFWLMAASFRVLGLSDVSMRLWQLLLALVLVALTYHIARAAGASVEEGLLASFMLATAIQFFYQTTVPQQDVALTLFLTLAMYGVLRYLQAGTAAWAVVTAAAVALAVLTKGIAGLGLFGAVVVVAFTVVRPTLPWRRVLVHAALAALVFAAVALPWFVLGLLRQGQPFARTFLTSGTLGVGRFFRPMISDPPPYLIAIFAYVPLLFLGMLPWTPILIAMLADLPRLFRTGPMGFKVIAVWFLVIFAVLSLSSGDKVFRYLLPFYPPAAILLGRTAAALFGQPVRLRRIGWTALPAASLLAGGFAWLWSSFPPARGLMIAVVLPFVIAVSAGLVGFMLASAAGRGRTAVAIAGGATLVGFTLFGAGMMANAAVINPWPAIRQAASPRVAASERVVLYGPLGQAFNFAALYFSEPVVVVSTPDALASLWTRQRVLLVISEEQYEGLTAQLAPAPVIIHRSPARLLLVANWTQAAP